MDSLTGLPWAGVRYFCTTREAGSSAPPYQGLNLASHVADSPEAVEANRARLRQLLPAEPLWLDQVHGSDVWDADTESAVDMPKADAAVTTQKGRVLAIMTADCLPVIIADGCGTVLGAAHAGWRGLAAGVLENTFAQMRRVAPRAAGWRAWIGPAISQACFEVGEDVRDAFVSRNADLAMYFAADPVRGRWRADLPSIARHRLFCAGVRQVECSGLCTYTDTRHFYSYRRESPTGRQATLAWLSVGSSDFP
ncbi:MAG: peptidoglycan editing factor PgeF [Alcaligenaceae bacterium]|nr:peptidoglycan editing factor PgeF [Alcaligenaceae bacterium]